MSNQLKSDPSLHDDAKWASVRDAISERWPQVNRDELAECRNDARELVDYVKTRVGAGADEIESLVQKLAPHGAFTDRVTHAASDQVHRAREATQAAYRRADECIAERPTESVLTSFVAGVVVGGVVTALMMRCRAEPSTWDRLKSQSYF